MVLGNGNEISVSTNNKNGGNIVNIPMPILKKGSKGNEVKTLQRLLVYLGYNLGNYGAKKDGVDGEFGDKCHSAVIKFQKANKLEADGIVGENTWKKLLK